MKRSKQERELTDEERMVVVAVRHCAGELNDIIQGARRKAQANSHVFAQSGVSVLFRAVESYADMYEKLALKSRDALDRLFTKFADCEEVRDAQDAIDETEGNWRTFLRNLDREISREPHIGTNGPARTSQSTAKCHYFVTSEFPLTDIPTNKEISLGDFVSQNTCVFVTFQPAYWPDTCVRWRHSEITKVQADLSQFKVGFVVVTWGPAEIIRPWFKRLHRVVKWPILWDKTGAICKKFGFGSGLEKVWAAENLNFLGCQRSMHGRPIERPPSDFDWLAWNQIGGEAVIARPVTWDPSLFKSSATESEHVKSKSMKRKHDDDETDSKQDGHDSEEETDSESFIYDVKSQSKRDRNAIEKGETKVCLLHRSSYIADLLPPGSIYQAALTAYAHLHNTTEARVMDRIRQNRRFSTAPESARLQYEPTSGLYYDPETLLYYDSERGYFYDNLTHMYYYWSQSEHRYISANTLIQAEIASAQAAQIRASQEAATRAINEREAARRAAMKVAAELAEIRAAKDDYAAYVYATCVVPQQEGTTTQNPVQTNVPSENSANVSANKIESSLKAWDPKPSLVPYGDDAINDPATPPPPGL